MVSNALVAAVGTAHRRQRPYIDGGACRCKGGPAHCPACEKKPIYRTFSKSAGRGGASGNKGSQRPPRDDPLEGEPGDPGETDIIVRHQNNDRPRYSSKFDLELVSFDVEDGNGDGIFEPGDDIIVRQIRVQNKGRCLPKSVRNWLIVQIGGMPSPISPIPCEVIPMGLVARRQGENAQSHLPRSIPAGNIEFADESVRCRLTMPTMSPRSVAPYFSEENITLQAVLPWLKQPLEQFVFAKSITVRFPLELQSIKAPSALAPRFGYAVTWQVRHSGSDVEIGADCNSSSTRATCFSAREWAHVASPRF